MHKYTIDSNGDIIVHKIVKNTNRYGYIFNNNATQTKIEESGDSNSTYEVLTVPLDIQGRVDISKYTISMELLINL